MNSKITIAAFAVLIIATQGFVLSSENVTFTIGEGFNYESGHTTNTGFNIYGEVIFKVNDVLSLGGGIQYLFAGSNRLSYGYHTFQDDYDNRRRNVDYYHYSRSVDIVLPYFVMRNNFDVLRFKMYSKLSIGIGYGVSKLICNDNKYAITNDTYVVGVVPSLGKTIIKSNTYGFNVEGGYRFVKSGKLDDRLYINYDNKQYGLSGWFFQTGISFSL